jgi:hypothetical protein
MASWTAAQLAALEEAIAEGVTTVQYSDRQVVYRSLTDMLRLRDVMRRDIGLLASDGTGTRRYFEYSGKGN